MNDRTSPLAQIRVLNLGGGWAGRVASALLADQGADVIEIQRRDHTEALLDALLGRGKSIVSLDLNVAADRAAAQSLIDEADIVFDNLGPGRAERFGLDHARVRARNPRHVYVSMPGFAQGSPLAGVAAWEGTIAASNGVYTDIHSMGPALGGAPIFTAVPMASAYGGVHAAVAATVGLLHLLETGAGQLIEVPLADAVLSAMALLIMKVEGQPRRYDLPPVEKSLSEVAFPILRDLHDALGAAHRKRIADHLAQFVRPQFTNYICADGKPLFINAVDHVHHSRACLEVLGLLNEFVANGMIIGSPYQEGGEGNNICSSGLSMEWAGRMRAAMAKRLATRPAHEWESLLRKAGVPATVVRTSSEWLAWPQAREGGNVAELDDPRYGNVTQVGRFVTIDGPASASPALQARRLAQTAAWAAPRIAVTAPAAGAADRPMLSGIRVLDLSNVIAGPAAGRVFAEFGADVIRIDPPAPQAGPRMTMWFGLDVNQGKRAIILDLKSAEGRGVLERLVRESDVVIHNFLDRSTDSLGISAHQLRAINPRIVSCQVSAWGGPTGGPLKDDPAFDPVLQAATGITARYGKPDAPVLHGLASCVDYITGFTAALGAIQALVARKRSGQGAYVRTSLSMGAQLVQFPFVIDSATHPRTPEPTGQAAVGYGPHYRQYRTRDGWAFLACRPKDLERISGLLGAANADAASLEQALAGLGTTEAAQQIRPVAAASIVLIRRLDDLREATTITDPASFANDRMQIAMVKTDHPSGYPVSLPLPTWYRLPSKAPVALSAAPAPGADTRSVLAQFGVSDQEWHALKATGAVRERWEVLLHYLPR